MEGAIKDGIEFKLKSSSDLRMESNLIYSLRIVIQTVVSWKGDESHQFRLECVRNMVRCCTGTARRSKVPS
jgi:hypothetical protein